MAWTARDPLRASPGGHREAGGPPSGNEAEAEAHVLHVEEHDLHAKLRHIEHMFEEQREKRGRFYSEIMYQPLGKRAEPESTTQDQFRVTYVYAYCGGGAGVTATLYLKGQASSPTLKLPIPDNTKNTFAVPLGDERTGGIILERRDLRYITTDDGSAQLLIVILAGEILSDTYLS